MSNHGRFCECRECEREKHMGAAPRDPVGGLVGITGREYERLKKCQTEVDRLAAENEALKRDRDEAIEDAKQERSRSDFLIAHHRAGTLMQATFEATRDLCLALVAVQGTDPDDIAANIRALTLAVLDATDALQEDEPK